jgi:hypothetical protein
LRRGFVLEAGRDRSLKIRVSVGDNLSALLVGKFRHTHHVTF